MRKTVLMLGVSFLLASPAFANAADAGGSSEAEKGTKWFEAEDSERVCRRERVAGSHIPMRVCRTRAQVRAQDEASRRQLREMQAAPILNRPSPQ